MARKVFFSFHYGRDAWRVSQVRHSWLTKPNADASRFVDAASFEQVKRQGDDAVKRWIDSNMEGTSVTIVLIGSETASRRWVRYEVARSRQLGKGVIGIRIH